MEARRRGDGREKEWMHVCDRKNKTKIKMKIRRDRVMTNASKT